MEDSMEELENLIAGMEAEGEGEEETRIEEGMPPADDRRLGRVIRRIEVEASTARDDVAEVLDFLEIFCFISDVVGLKVKKERRERDHEAMLPKRLGEGTVIGSPSEISIPTMLRILAETGGCGVAKC